MTDDWKTLRVPADKYEEAKAQKEAAGRTWGEQIVRPEGKVGVHQVGDGEPVEYIDGEPTPEDFDSIGDVLAELKRTRELVERMPDRTADELEGRFGGHP